MLTKDSVLFYWDAALKGALPVVGGDPVFTRDGSGYFIDSEGKLRKAIVNRPRFEWADLDDGYGTRPVMLLELARTNRVLYSEGFGAWNAEGTPVLTTGQPDPFGGAAATLIEDNDAGNIEGITRGITFVGDGTKAVTLFVKRGPSPSASGAHVYIYDTVLGTRGRITVTFSASGVPTVTADAGGAVLRSIPCVDGWWRVGFLTDAITAANSITAYIRPAKLEGEIGNMYIFGFQAEDGVFSTAYVPTSGDTASRPADAFYWKNPPPPQAMAAYMRFVAMHNTGPSNQRLWQMGSATDGNPRFLLFRAAANTFSTYHNNVGAVQAGLALAHAAGDVVEVVSVLHLDGKVRTLGAVNGAAVSSAGPSVAEALGAAWADQRLYLNSVGASSINADKYADLKIVKLADMTAQPGVATNAAVMSELRNFKLNAAGVVI